MPSVIAKLAMLPRGAGLLPRAAAALWVGLGRLAGRGDLLRRGLRLRRALRSFARAALADPPTDQYREPSSVSPPPPFARRSQ